AKGTEVEDLHLFRDGLTNGDGIGELIADECGGLSDEEVYELEENSPDDLEVVEGYILDNGESSAVVARLCLVEGPNTSANATSVVDE
nr:hypothetical protein [Tanacetum cinerariifolium]